MRRRRRELRVAGEDASAVEMFNKGLHIMESSCFEYVQDASMHAIIKIRVRGNPLTRSRSGNCKNMFSLAGMVRTIEVVWTLDYCIKCGLVKYKCHKARLSLAMNIGYLITPLQGLQNK